MASLSRRHFLSLGVAAALSYAAEEDCPADPILQSEYQRGDPDGPDEQITWNPDVINRLTNPASKAMFSGLDPNLPLSTIEHAKGFVGADRTTSPDQIAAFLDLFELPLKNENGYVPFCAAGLSYCALLAYTADLKIPKSALKTRSDLQRYLPDLDHYYFYPTVSCRDMQYIAEGRHRWLNQKSGQSLLPKPGWIVLFDWTNSGTPDHCGLICASTPTAIKTIEFNTSGTAGGSQRDGGTVAYKTRSYEHVKGFITS